ncbi:filamentous hemagglutinin N-terminal domain-containing protein [Salmonella enterica]
MNKIYRLKFDKRRNELVVVSEITAGMGKEKSTGHIADLSALSPFRKLLGTLTPLALLTGLIISLFPGMALANPDLPTGGQIVGGQGSISTSGNQMTIHQQTQNMATNWHSFDVGKNNTVQFVQPDSSSVALNRVTGGSGSQIMGTLKANGQVFILNPNGVLFGKDARVNVAGLVASTKNLSTADFMKGQYTLSGSGTSGVQVINQGSLTTSKGGYIVLAGERVSNSGTVTTPGGKTVLAAGKTVTLQLDNGGLASVSVNGSVVNALVENRGLISATNGQVYLTAKGQDMLLNTVVNNSGTIEAKGLESRGGEIVLNGGDSGVVSQSGRLLADSQTGQGGKVILEGQNIHLAGSSLTSATGKTGGGEVYVGGGWQGKDSVIRNASKVVMDKTATVDVSATDAGNGGTAVLWSDDYTNFRGAVLAKGGAQSGNGGRVETSSHNNLQAFGEVNTSARAGHGGEWLLDPTDVTIVGAGTDTGIDSTTSAGIFTPTASGAQILNSSIQSQLNAGTNVTVKTSGTVTAGQSGNITVNADIVKAGGADASLTLEAGGNITLSNHNITSSGGKLDISLLGGGSNSGRIWINNSTLSSNGGNITIDQFKHRTVEGDVETVNPNAMTVTVSKSTLNTASSIVGIPKGDITVNAYNPNVALAKTNAAHNGGTQIQVTGGSVLTGGDIVLSSEQSGSNANRLPVFINGATITGDGDVTLRGVVTKGGIGATMELRGANNTLESVSGDILLENQMIVRNMVDTILLNGDKAADNGPALIARHGNITLNGSSVNGVGVQTRNARMNAEHGNIILNGLSKNDTGVGVKVISSTRLSAQNGSITLNGNGDTGKGVMVSNTTLNASAANINAIMSKSGTGFSVTNSTFEGALSDLSAVAFSSAGSGVAVTNLLDSSVVTAGNRASLMSRWHPENMTEVDMGGQAIFNNSTTGWVADYSSVDYSNNKWIFGNTSVIAGGDVHLRGVNFSDSTINLSAGNLDIDNPDSVLLRRTDIIVSNGLVNITSGKENIKLTGGSITTGADSSLNLKAGGNITLSNHNISSSVGKLDINLLGAGSDSGMVSIVNSTLGSNGGNITIDQLNHKTVESDVETVNPNAITVKIDKSTLNTTSSIVENQKGDITVNAYNPNVSLTVPIFNDTIRNGGVQLEVGGGSVLTGGNIVLLSEQSGAARRWPVYINGATITGDSDVTLRGVGTDGGGGIVELRGDNNTLTSVNGNITLENNVMDKRTAILLNGTTGAAGSTLIAQHGNITLNGSGVNGVGVVTRGVKLSAQDGSITLNGTGNTGNGVEVSNTILNASTANINGIIATSGMGFSVTNSTFEGVLSDLSNVAFSSKGSSPEVTNLLDSSVVTAGNRDSLMKRWHPDNMTQVDLGGQAIFNDSTTGWVADYSSEEHPYGGWILGNTSVTAGGDVSLKGVGFSDSKINLSAGSLDIDNRYLVLLKGTSITVDDGSVSIHSGAGSIRLTGGSAVSAKNDITVSADKETIILSGEDSLLNSSAGRILMKSGRSVDISSGAKAQAFRELSVVVDNKNDENNNIRLFRVLNASLSGSNVNVSVNGNVSGYSSLLFLSKSSFSGDEITINTSGDVNGGGASGAEIYYLNEFDGNLNFNINGKASFEPNSPSYVFLGGGSLINVTGNASISSSVTGQGSQGSALFLAGGVNVSGDLSMSGISGDDGTGIVSVNEGKELKAGGAITIYGKSNDGYGVLVTNGSINGDKIVVTGESVSGVGAYLSDGLVLNNAEIKGISYSGVGTEVADGVSLMNSTVNGTSVTGTGMVLTGELTQDASSIVSGNSEGNGTGVFLGGMASVSGGAMTAASVDGTGLQVEKGGRGDDVVINAQTVNGRAIEGEDNALVVTGSTSISTVGDAGNEEISESVKPVQGGTPSGVIAEVLGNKLSDSIATLQNILNTKLAGLQQALTAQQTQLDLAARAGTIGLPDLTRLEAVVSGLSDRVRPAAELKDAVSALKADTASLEERLKKADVFSTMLEGLTLPAAADISAVGTELGAAKELHSATASLQGGLTARLEENENVRHLLDSLKQQLKDAQEKGTAGGAVLAAMQTQLEGLDLQQRSYVDELAHIRQHLVKVSLDGSSPVTSRQESVNGLQTALSRVSGVSNMQVSALDNQLQKAMTGYARLVATAQGQAVVNAQTPLQNQDQQDGFHAGGEPPVPVSGYQSQPKNVDIRLCDNDGCRSMALDAGKPSLSQVAASTESR